MEPDLICWGDVSTEAYCTLHEDFDPTCASCVYAKEAMQRAAETVSESHDD